MPTHPATTDERVSGAPPAAVRRRLATSQWNACDATVAVAITEGDAMPAVRAECDQVLTELYAPHADDAGGGWAGVATGADVTLHVPPDVELDGCAVGQAHAADVLVRAVPGRTGTSMIVAVGTSVAVGRPAGTPPHRWQVAVAERAMGEREAQQARVTGGATDRGAVHRARRLTTPPADPLTDTLEHLHDVDRAGAEVIGLEEGAIATATAAHRRRLRQHADTYLLSAGKSSLDPLWHTVAVWAPTCVDACVASLIAMSLGDQAPAWLWQNEMAARLVAADGRIMRMGRWPTR